MPAKFVDLTDPSIPFEEAQRNPWGLLQSIRDEVDRLVNEGQSPLKIFGILKNSGKYRDEDYTIRQIETRSKYIKNVDRTNFDFRAFEEMIACDEVCIHELF